MALVSLPISRSMVADMLPPEAIGGWPGDRVIWLGNRQADIVCPSTEEALYRPATPAAIVRLATERALSGRGTPKGVDVSVCWSSVEAKAENPVDRP
jgi:hypothetical protein